MKDQLKLFMLFIALLLTFWSNAQRKSQLPVYPIGTTSLDSNCVWLSDLFDKRISNEVTIVGIGEVVHRGIESSELNAKIVQYLIEKKGFKNVLLEQANASISLINYYLNEDKFKNKDTLTQLVLVELGGITDKAEIDLLYWIKQFNLSHPLEKVSVRGIDIVDLRSRFANYFMYNFAQNLDTNTKNTIDALWKLNKKDSLTGIIINWVKQHKDTLSKKYQNYYYYSDLLFNVKNAEFYQLYKSLNRNIDYKSFLRDSIMAENILNLSSQKSIVLSHNLHATTTDGSVSLGNMISNKLKNKYYVIVNDFLEKASIWVVDSIGNPYQQDNFSPMKNTLGYQLYRQRNITQGVVFYSEIPKCNLPALFGSIGIKGHYETLGRGKGFDALFLLKEITPTKIVGRQDILK